jgi:hypothetical protein
MEEAGTSSWKTKDGLGTRHRRQDARGLARRRTRNPAGGKSTNLTGARRRTCERSGSRQP